MNRSIHCLVTILLSLLLSSAFFSVRAQEALPEDPIRIIDVQGHRFYIPQSWLPNRLSETIPTFDKSLPREMVFRADGGIQFSMAGYNLDEYASAPERDRIDGAKVISFPMPWHWTDFKVGLVDLRGRPLMLDEEFKEIERKVRVPGHDPYNCDERFFDPRATYDYCDFDRSYLNGIWIRVRWSGRKVNPKDWPLLERRAFKVLDWLRLPPDQRPAIITD